MGDPTDRERWARLLELFADAREADPGARAALLERVANEDASLAAEVQSLLDADARSGPMDGPTGALWSTLRGVTTPPPEAIGPYRIAGELGRGGMGVVYLAERADGHFAQQVAIKLIDATDTNDPLHQRFLAERRILAGLVHPNIARLLDGGVLDDGRPYLVLEYVDGLPITTYCDRHQLALRDRLQLFARVCDAVQHAHRNLIIHRDLKPTNILVSRDGRPHLLDFGIAKLMTPADAAPAEPVTRHGARPMTPEYASPEQVRSAPLTTASDIYALGVLLYVLLCGRSPYRLTGDSLVELATAICEQDPERPSARAARGDTDAAARSTTPDRLARLLAGDLDGIVLMALRKEPERRYASADVLRQDIERHLAGLPVIAHEGSRRYRIGKFVRRYRVEVGATAVMLGGLVAGLTLAVAEGRRANRERARAEQARAQSEGVSDFMMELFQSGDADDTVTAASLTAIDLLRRGATRANALSGQPAVQGRLLDVVGRMSLHLGRLDEAEQLLGQAVAIRRTSDGGDALALSASLIHLARVHRTRGAYDRARALAAEALALRQQSLPPRHPDIAEALYELGWLGAGPSQEALYRQALDILPDTGAIAERRVTLLNALSTNLRRQGRFADAVTSSREAVQVAETALGVEHHATGAAMIHLADHVRDLEDDAAQAERLYRRGLALLELRFGVQSVRLLHGLNSLGTLLSRRGNPEAESLARRALAIRRSAAGPEHPEVAGGLQLLAVVLAQQGRLREAESLQRQALAHSVRALGEHHPAVRSDRLPRLAEILAAQGRVDESDALFEQALGPPPLSGVAEGEVRRDYGRALLARGAYGRAERELLRALAVLETHYATGEHPNVLESKRALMTLYARWGRPAQAERYRVPPGRYVSY